MKHLSFLFLFLMFGNFAILGQDQRQTLLLEFINESYGFPDQNLGGMIQDHLGFLWITSRSGLIKYDGIQTKVYCNSPRYSGDQVARPDCRMSVIKEDAQGDIWVLGLDMTKGTASRTFFHFDRKAEIFTSYADIVKDTALLVHLHGSIINDIVVERRFIWVLKPDGILKIEDYRDPATNAFRPYPKYRLFRTPPIEGRARSNQIAELDDDNRLWMSSLDGLLLWDATRDTFERFRVQPSAPPADLRYHMNEISIAADGGIWLDGNTAFYRFDPDKRQFTSYPIPGKRFFTPIFVDSGGRIWTGQYQGAGGLSWYEPEKNKWIDLRPQTAETQFDRSGTIFRIREIIEDHSGVIWLATDAGGLYKYDPQNAHFHWLEHNPKDQNSLAAKGVSAIAEAEDQVYWLSTFGGGLNRWDRKADRWEQFHFSELPATFFTGNQEELVKNLLDVEVDGDGEIWFVYPFGIGRYDPLSRAFKFYPTNILRDRKAPFIGSVHHVSVDRKGHISIGSAGGYLGGWQTFDKKTDAFVRPVPKIRMIGDVYEDRQGVFWIGTFFVNPNFFRYDPTLDSLHRFELSNAQAFWETDNDMWVGTQYNGLIKIDKASLSHRRYDETHGLPHNNVRGVLGDDHGNLWISTRNGLARFDPDSEHFQVYDKTDGLRTEKFFGTAMKNSLGELFFPSGEGLLYFHPDSIVSDQKPPPVALTEIQLFNQTLPIGGSSPLQEHISVAEKVTFKHWQNDLTLHFAALHYKNPQRNRFRVKLEPYDREWRELGTKREANYTSLNPGNYVFRLKAANSDGVWNEKGVSLKIVVLPPWWQTWWAKVLYVLAALSFIFGYIRWRTYSLRKRQTELEETVTKRTAEVVAQKEIIEQEKERSEELLLNILPTETAEELKQYGAAKAKNYDMVTVLFTDFKDFSRFAKRLSPEELVAEIDYCYQAFDRIMDTYNVEKIKTIGDAYMAAAGLPTPSTSNPADALHAALAIRDFMTQYQQERITAGKEAFEVRIGVHTGPVVAGIVGIKKFAYDIWGDTVNIAARMEKHSLPGRVNVSQRTYELLQNDPSFSFDHRGQVEAKGMGSIEMYFVQGKTE